MASSAAKQSDLKHQRKHSSSKASSSSKDEPRPITTASKDGTPTEPPPVKRSGGRRSSRTVSKPSAIKARVDAYPNIPSVPSTQHLHPMNVHVASFFSRHRPISVTTSFPPAFSEADFSTIFEPKRPQPLDVINTVSSAIDSLESAAFQDHDEDATYAQQQKPSRRSNAQTNIKHLDGTNNDTRTHQISLDISDLSKSFRHFVPPPPPVPITNTPSSKQTSASKRRERNTPIKERTYSTTLTLTERTLPSGLKTYEASVSPVMRTSSSTRPSRSTPRSVAQTLTPNEVTMIDLTLPPSSTTFSAPPPFTPASTPQPFLERMRKRQQRWEDDLQSDKNKRQVWRLISVKRQRKLKMKKHKYKKLMRKTRNLRRRLDRN
ncbi:MAG: hypothetical protein L6R39_001979 [Caloplaca ligustica]|nr:MAG: hypothetical protein L6R39_001979 [Caloplaca ligustica]